MSLGQRDCLLATDRSNLCLDGSLLEGVLLDLTTGLVRVSAHRQASTTLFNALRRIVVGAASGSCLVLSSEHIGALDCGLPFGCCRLDCAVAETSRSSSETFTVRRPRCRQEERVCDHIDGSLPRATEPQRLATTQEAILTQENLLRGLLAPAPSFGSFPSQQHISPPSRRSCRHCA